MPGLRHAFFGRMGGASRGAFRSLNCSAGVGDEAEAVRLNRRRTREALGCERLQVARQVHGAHIVTAGQSAAAADGLVTSMQGLAVGVLTADCVPILLVVPEARLAAAVHAGWKGTALGIAGAAVEHLARQSSLPAAAVHAALGPSIGSCCYEVGEDVIAALEDGAGRGRVLPDRRHGGRSWIDLRRINAAILQAAGVPKAQIHHVGPCTRCAVEQCFSHRGSGGVAGRQLSAVGWS
jgi:hypothetical protein